MPVFEISSQRLLYIHIPKTGGTSIEQYYSKIYPMSHRGKVNPDMGCSPQHMHATLLIKTFDLESFIKIFATVRHPISRIISEYKFRYMIWVSKRKKNPNNFPRLNEWIDKSLDKYTLDAYYLDNHLRPQHEFLVPETKIYKLEEGLDKCVYDINTVLHLDQLPITRIHMKSLSPSNTHLENLSKKNLNRIFDLYDKDFEILKYDRKNY